MGQNATPNGVRRIVPLLKLVAAAVLGLVAWDAAVFRSGLYVQVLEPRSLAGATRNALHLVGETYAAGRRNVLVLGNSKVGEALAPIQADATVAGSGLHFVNGFIPGSDLRIWYYLLREIDPQANRFSAIVLAVPYDPQELLSEMADSPADIGYLAPLLRIQDIGLFPSSFEAPSLQSQARRAILFPAQPMRLDIAAMFNSPWQRYEHLMQFRRSYVSQMAVYSGRPNTLPGLQFDPDTGQPIDWDAVDASLRPFLEGYFKSLRAQPAAAVLESNQRYCRDWLQRIAAPYHAQGIPVFLIEMPRGPWHESLMPVPKLGGSVAAVVDAGLAIALPGDTFADLERPGYFFDVEHMNRFGREKFTPRLAQRIAALLH